MWQLTLPHGGINWESRHLGGALTGNAASVEVLHHARAGNCADALVGFRLLLGHIVSRGELV